MADEKILKDEILNEEQLDEVAGGTHDQTSSDMEHLYHKYGIQWPQNWDDAVGQLGGMFWRAGMRLDTSGKHSNQYFERTPYGERSISQQEARRRLDYYVSNGGR